MHLSLAHRLDHLASTTPLGPTESPPRKTFLAAVAAALCSGCIEGIYQRVSTRECLSESINERVFIGSRQVTWIAQAIDTVGTSEGKGQVRVKQAAARWLRDQDRRNSCCGAPNGRGMMSIMSILRNTARTTHKEGWMYEHSKLPRRGRTRNLNGVGSLLFEKVNTPPVNTLPSCLQPDPRQGGARHLVSSFGRDGLLYLSTAMPELLAMKPTRTVPTGSESTSKQHLSPQITRVRRTWYRAPRSDQGWDHMMLSSQGSKYADAHVSLQLLTMASNSASSPPSPPSSLSPRGDLRGAPLEALRGGRGPRAPGERRSPSPFERPRCMLVCNLTRSGWPSGCGWAVGCASKQAGRQGGREAGTCGQSGRAMRPNE